MRLFRTLKASPFLHAFLVVGALEPQCAGVPQEIPDIAKAVCAAENAYELAPIYEKMCEGASEGTLDDLKTNKHTGIDIRAAWEMVRRTMNANLHGDDEPERIDPKAIQRFLGFLEGRLSTRLPSWFESRLLRAGYHNRRDWMICPGLHWIHPYPEVGPDVNHILVSRGMSVTKAPDGLKLVLGREVLSVPATVMKIAERIRDGSGEEAVSLNAMVVDRERFLIVIYTAECQEYPLLCVSRSTGKVIWQALVWPGIPRVAGDPFSQLTDIRIAKSTVLIFGLTDSSAYVEGFSLADGKNRFHFCTSY
ncbi:MAG: hypothetical protein WCB27_13445 [Thermoguttaceae bacterium]